MTTLASTSAIAGVAAKWCCINVSYDDNGTAASATSHDCGYKLRTGTAGSTTVTWGADVRWSYWQLTGVDMATTIGPVTIAADMHDEVSLSCSY